MKIILVTAGMYSIPAMHFLAGQNQLHSVVTLGGANKNNIPIELTANHLKLPFKRFLKDELLTIFKEWLSEAGADMVLVFGCGYKLPAVLFTIPKFGFFNVHFSLLPAYRGKSPVFWQIKNGESTGGITIHQMTEAFDAGPMLAQQEIPISTGDSFGLFSGRLSLESVALIAKAIEKLNNTGNGMLLPQNEARASYFHGPAADDMKIDWEAQSAREIECLVNAANPDYGGAITLFRGQPLRILEVNSAELNSNGDIKPGTIAYSDLNYGVFASCKNAQFLRINIVQTSEGIFSGFKLASLGIAAGEVFENAANLFGITVNP